MQLINTVDVYMSLMDCNIEGMEPMVAKFQHIFSSIKKKPYDVLDHRKLDFDQDFQDFKRQMSDLEVCI